MNNNTRKFFGFLIASVFTASASAALYDRGNGMIYDSTQNITWLQNANYAKTSGYDADGQMTWSQSTVWANDLVFGGYNDWRLASAKLNGTGYLCGGSYSSCPGYYNGANDVSYNNSHSEIGHLFFELGNSSYYDTNGVARGQGVITPHTSFIDAATQQNVNFLNMQVWTTYWEKENDPSFPFSAWIFSMSNGVQSSNSQSANNYAWAVRDGDVLAVNEVPVPAAAWLMGSGLIGLAGIARRKK